MRIVSSLLILSIQKEKNPKKLDFHSNRSLVRIMNSYLLNKHDTMYLSYNWDSWEGRLACCHFNIGIQNLALIASLH